MSKNRFITVMKSPGVVIATRCMPGCFVSFASAAGAWDNRSAAGGFAFALRFGGTSARFFAAGGACLPATCATAAFSTTAWSYIAARKNLLAPACFCVFRISTTS